MISVCMYTYTGAGSSIYLVIYGLHVNLQIIVLARPNDVL